VETTEIVREKSARLKWIHATQFAAVLFVLLALVLVLFRAASGQSLGLKSSVSSAIHGAKSLVYALRDASRVRSYNHGQFTSVVFLHHSVGSNLIKQGELRRRFAAAGFQLWDHGYNAEGLRDPHGTSLGYSYNVPSDNTDPDGLAQILAQPVYPIPLNTFSALLQYEVIVFKSCFPVSHIVSDEQFARDQSYYLSIRARADDHPDKLFILMTPPPLNPAETDVQAAARARKLANWLKSDGFIGGHPNFFTFDLFGYLAESDPAAADANRLSKAYREDADSHPNRLANETIGPLFVDFVSQAVQQYRGPRPASTR
jgi:hypothetical protein